MHRKKGSKSDRAASLLRLAWYAVATILVLTLPIFSDWSGVSRTPPRERSVSSRDVERSVVRSQPEGPAQASASFGRAEASSVRTGGSPLRGAAGRVSQLDERDEARLADFSRRRSDPPASRVKTQREVGILPAPDEVAPREVIRGAAPRRPAPVWGGGATALQSELSEIDRGYDRAYATLFPEAALTANAVPNNPFEEALQDGAGEGSAGDGSSSGGESQPDAGAGNDSGDAPSDPDPAPEPPEPEPDGGDSDPGSDPFTPPPDPEPEPAPRTQFSFVLIGAFPGNPTLVSRANLVGNVFILENAYEVDFFPGALPTLIGFSNNERVLTTDFNQDGLTDFAASRVEPTVGSVIESYLQVSPGVFKLQGSTVLYLQEVKTFAFFDLTGDGREELVVLVRGSDRLIVYQLHGRDWTYLREMVLPFRPGAMMVSSAGAPVGSRLLYVTDEALRYVVNLSPRQPETFRFGSRAPLNHLFATEINWTGSGSAPLLVFQLQDVVVLAEQQGADVQTLGVFDLRRTVPEVILGDYSGAGSRQILWVP